MTETCANATNASNWVYFSFSNPISIKPDNPDNSIKWDLGFKRYKCGAKLIERIDFEWEESANTFEERFADTFNHMKSMPDFRMFKLTPTEGLFVIGFGQAYLVSGSNLNYLSHLGHKNTSGNINNAHGVKVEL